MNGKDFEKITLERMQLEEKRGRATVGRYGVQGTFIADKPLHPNWIKQVVSSMFNARTEADCVGIVNFIAQEARKTGGGWQKMESNPDFEGVIAGCGQQFTYDCKVCGDASFPLDRESGSQSRQLRHLLKRGKFGAIAFYLIHFTARELKTKSVPALTIAFPVHPEHPFWVSFMRGESKRISRDDCERYGVEVFWNLPTERSLKLSPDLLDAIFRLREMDRSGGFLEVATSKPF